MYYCQDILFNGAQRNEDAVVPARARRVREQVIAADSVSFRRPDRRAAPTPYISADAVAVPPAPVPRAVVVASADNDDTSDSSASAMELLYSDIVAGSRVGTESEGRFLES